MGQTGYFHGTNGTRPRNGCDPEVEVFRQLSLCLLFFLFLKKGEAKPHEETPQKKQFPTLLISVRCAISPLNSFRFPEFASDDPLINHLRRVSNNGFQAHPREVLLFGASPPSLGLPRSSGIAPDSFAIRASMHTYAAFRCKFSSLSSVFLAKLG